MWGAIRALRVQRIDHGIRSLEDAELVQYLADARLPITLCPLSNLRLQVSEACSQLSLHQQCGVGLEGPAAQHMQLQH